MREIAFYGGSFNPPTEAHRAIVEHLLKVGRFEIVIVKPCGLRKDKPTLAQEDRSTRLHSVLGLSHPGYRLDLSGLSKPMMPTWEEWQGLRRNHPGAKLWLVTGADLFAEEHGGRCQVERWVRGGDLFRNASFLIFPRQITTLLRLPAHWELARGFTPLAISSSQLRAQHHHASRSGSSSGGRPIGSCPGES